MIIALDKEELKEILPNKEVEPLDFVSQEDWHKLRSKGVGGSDIGAVSYTHLTLPTNREV